MCPVTGEVHPAKDGPRLPWRAEGERTGKSGSDGSERGATRGRRSGKFQRTCLGEGPRAVGPRHAGGRQVLQRCWESLEGTRRCTGGPARGTWVPAPLGSMGPGEGVYRSRPVPARRRSRCPQTSRAFAIHPDPEGQRRCRRPWPGGRRGTPPTSLATVACVFCVCSQLPQVPPDGALEKCYTPYPVLSIRAILLRHVQNARFAKSICPPPSCAPPPRTK
jgi:hypothetical protein